MRVVVEGAGDQHVEPRLGGFARGGDEVHAGERAELRADQDARAALDLAFQEAAFGADILAWPRLQAAEVDAVGFLGLVHARGAQMIQHHGREIDGRCRDLPLRWVRSRAQGSGPVPNRSGGPRHHAGIASTGTG